MMCHSEQSEESLRGMTIASLRMTTILAAFLLSACASPEADRPPGHPGADIHNWGRPVEMHAGADPYHDTPCVEQIECTGPRAIFGRTPPPD